MVARVAVGGDCGDLDEPECPGATLPWGHLDIVYIVYIDLPKLEALGRVCRYDALRPPVTQVRIPAKMNARSAHCERDSAQAEHSSERSDDSSGSRAPPDVVKGGFILRVLSGSGNSVGFQKDRAA
jgi:hypothetical protein